MNVLLLVVEDRGVREALQAALPSGALLVFESSVAAAARRLVSMQVDAILLDDGPKLGGPVLKALKSASPGTPIIVLSARGDVITEASFIRAGAQEVVTKPFDCAALDAAIASQVGHLDSVPERYGRQEEGVTRSAAIGQHQMAMRWLSRAAAYSDDLERLSMSLVESSADIFDAVRCVVLLESDGVLKVAASHGISSAITKNLELTYETGLMRWFDEHASLIDRDMGAQVPAVEKEMKLFNARLAAPLLRDGQVFGAIILGEKASGIDYAPVERELLTLIARSTGLAFQRAGVQETAVGSQEQVHSIFDDMSAGVIAVGMDKTISLMNQRAAEILEVSAEDLRGRSVQKLGSAFADVALRALAGELQMSPRDIADPAVGATLTLHACAGADGGAVVVFTKKHEEKVVADEIAESPFWEYLSSRMAQEVKNPMVAINTFAQLLPQKYDSEDFRDAFSRVVQDEVARINRVVETLFEFARDPKMSLRRCNVNDTVEGVLKTFQEELASHAIQLETAWDPKVEESQLDPLFFAQAVHNVVQNSIDAMSEGGTLTVDTVGQGTQTEIRISDTGPGVSAKDSDLIFLPFYSTKEQGMGLGLTLANRILKQHDGDLELVQDKSRGSCFSLHVPAKSRECAAPPHEEKKAMGQ